MAALLQYKNHFATTAFSTALLNIALIGALLISKDLGKYEITYYLSYGGVLVGGLLQVFVHLIAVKKHNLCKIFTFKKHKKKEENRFYKSFFWSNTRKFNGSYFSIFRYMACFIFS